MSAVKQASKKTFQALSVRNYRLYFTGQVVSVSGTWMQTIALALLILHIHGDGVNIGVATALQFVPMLALGSWGGLIADRMNKRTLLFFTQGGACLLALGLGTMTGFGHITFFEIYGFATLLGVVNLFDNPARQTFVFAMVGPDLLPNAVSLNTVLMNSARMIGPAIGGAVLWVTKSNYPICFFVNAATYVAVIIALSMMRTSDLHPSPKVKRQPGQVREGLRYVWGTPLLRNPLLVMSVAGIFAFNFTTTLPLLAVRTFHGGPGTYSLLNVGMAGGAVLGGLLVAYRSRPSASLLSVIGVIFGLMMMVVVVAPNEVYVVLSLFVMGIFSISFIATSNSTLQLQADPAMRGRVMALFATAFLGSTPIGAPLVGWIADASSPRIAILVGAATTLTASIFLAYRVIPKPRMATFRSALTRLGPLPVATTLEALGVSTMTAGQVVSDARFVKEGTAKTRGYQPQGSKTFPSTKPA